MYQNFTLAGTKCTYKSELGMSLVACGTCRNFKTFFLNVSYKYRTPESGSAEKVLLHILE